MNRSRNNNTQGSYSSSRSGLPNSSNRNFNNLDRNQAHRSDYQPRYDASEENYDDVDYGRQHEDTNSQKSVSSYRNQQNPQYSANDNYRSGNSFNTNIGADRNSTHPGQNFGDADRYGGNENYADRGYSQQAGGWGKGREPSSNVGRYTGGNNYAGGSSSQNDQQYPSTERFSSRDSQSQWQGNPSPNSSYGAEWNSLSGESTQSHAGRGPKNYKRSDERIHEDASEALTHAHHVDATEIEVEVKEGILTLSGTVTDKRTKRAAEECVENISGVKDVKNNLTVSSSAQTTHMEGDKSTKKPSTSSSKLQ